MGQSGRTGPRSWKGSHEESIGQAESGAWLATPSRDGKVNYYYQCPVTGTRLNAEIFDHELLRALRAAIGGPATFAKTLALARDEANQRAMELEGKVNGLKGQLAALDLQEGRLVDAIANGVPTGQVRRKLEEITKAREDAEAGLEGC